MKKLMLFMLPVSLMFACTPEQKVEEDPQFIRITEERNQFKQEKEEQDEIISSYFEAMNSIDSSLQAIYQKEKSIKKSKLGDVELGGDAKERIAAEINEINELMAKNRKKIYSLRKKLKASNVKIEQYEQQIASLEERLTQKDGEIVMLRKQLAGLNIEMELLYSENADLLRQMELQYEEMNQAWYAFGSKKELKAQGVITKDGGFAGLIGKSTKLKNDFNRDYFTRINITKTAEIPMGVKKAKLITSHPSDSYKFVGDGPIEKLEIINAQDFWSASKYLVIMVD